MQRLVDSYFAKKDPAEKNQLGSRSDTNDKQANAASASGTDDRRVDTLTKVTCFDPPYPDIYECMKDGAITSTAVKRRLLTEEWKEVNKFTFPSR